MGYLYTSAGIRFASKLVQNPSAMPCIFSQKNTSSMPDHSHIPRKVGINNLLASFAHSHSHLISYTALHLLYFIACVVEDRVRMIYWARGENNLHSIVRDLFFNATAVPLQSPYLMRLGLGLLRV